MLLEFGIIIHNVHVILRAQNPSRNSQANSNLREGLVASGIDNDNLEVR